MLLTQLRQTDPHLFASSFVLLMLSYALKVMRWHELVHVAGIAPRFRYSWETYNVGTFLGMITPGKVGEFSRVGYLKAHGVATGSALAAVLIDRAFDVAVIAVLALAAAGILFGVQWLLTCVAVSALGVLITALLGIRLRSARSRHAWLSFLLTIIRRPTLLTRLVLLTIISWLTYCAWAVVLARSISLDIPATALVSAVVIAGIIALLPVAPSGLGTRDASLIWLLAPFGVLPPEAVALSFLMLVSIVLSSAIGGWYWLNGITLHERL